MHTSDCLICTLLSVSRISTYFLSCRSNVCTAKEKKKCPPLFFRIDLSLHLDRPVYLHSVKKCLLLLECKDICLLKTQHGLWHFLFLVFFHGWFLSVVWKFESLKGDCLLFYMMFATLESALTVATQAYINWFSTKAINTANSLSNGSSVIDNNRIFAHLQTLICTDINCLATTGLFLLYVVIVTRF